MEQCDQNRNLPIVLKRNKYQHLSFLLSSILFIQRESGSVHVYKKDEKPTNLLSRSIKETKELIHQQDCDHHFYMNSAIIVSYHFIEKHIDLNLPDHKAIELFKKIGLRIGMNEFRNMCNSYKSKISV